MSIIKKSLSCADFRQVDPQMGIANLFSEPSASFDAVVGILKGSHGNFVNSKSEKAYFIIDGSGTVIIDKEAVSVRAMDFIYIPTGAEHGIRDELKALIICSPPFDPNTETKTNE